MSFAGTSVAPDVVAVGPFARPAGASGAAIPVGPPRGASALVAASGAPLAFAASLPAAGADEAGLWRRTAPITAIPATPAPIPIRRSRS